MTEQTNYEVIVVGGGLAGAMMALALSYGGYGSAEAPDSIKYQQKMIEDSLDKPIEFVQGNICKLSPWSLWSKCPLGCPSSTKKKRTRKVLNEPKGCYSPTNPILEQVIPCNSTQCFCNSDC